MRLPFARGFALVAAVPSFAAAQASGPSPEDQKRADLRIPELDRSALEPEKRAPVDVPPEERNPFGRLSVPPPEEEEVVKVEAETEEMKIRRVLGNMRVAGLWGTPGAYRALLGPMQLAQGDTLPQLFANQAETLRVVEITDRQIVLQFVERKQQGDLPPRTIGLNFDLAPRVRSVLPGELFTKTVQFDERGMVAEEPLKTPSVEAIIRAAETGQSIEAVVDLPRPLLGDGNLTAKDEKTPEDATE